MENAIDLIKKNWNYEKTFLDFDKFFKASILIPLCEINEKSYVIFEKRSKSIKQGDEICFPGGKYENSDINFSFTAIRESSEELGISIEKIEILKELNVFVTPFNSIIYSFLGFLKIDSFDELIFNTHEVQKLIFIPLSWLLDQEPEIYKIYQESHPHTFDKFGNQIKTFPAKDYGLPEKYHSSWSNGFREIYLYNYQGDIIWGFTASILKDFLEKFKKL